MRVDASVVKVMELKAGCAKGKRRLTIRRRAFPQPGKLRFLRFVFVRTLTPW
jgi:hypothetical protein